MIVILASGDLVHLDGTQGAIHRLENWPATSSLNPLREINISCMKGLYVSRNTNCLEIRRLTFSLWDEQYNNGNASWTSYYCDNCNCSDFCNFRKRLTSIYVIIIINSRAFNSFCEKWMFLLKTKQNCSKTIGTRTVFNIQKTVICDADTHFVVFTVLVLIF